MEQLGLIAVFLFVLLVLLGSGVWVGLALLGVAFVGMELFTDRPHRGRYDHDHLDHFILVVPDCTATVYLNGRNSVSDTLVERYVQGTGALVERAARRLVAYQYRWLRRVRRCLGILCRNPDHGRQNVDTGIAPA